MMFCKMADVQGRALKLELINQGMAAAPCTVPPQIFHSVFHLFPATASFSIIFTSVRGCRLPGFLFLFYFTARGFPLPAPLSYFFSFLVQFGAGLRRQFFPCLSLISHLRVCAPCEHINLNRQMWVTATFADPALNFHSWDTLYHTRDIHNIT